MGLQAIEAVPKDGSPVFLVDKDTGDMNRYPLGSGPTFVSKRGHVDCFFPNATARGSARELPLCWPRLTCVRARTFNISEATAKVNINSGGSRRRNPWPVCASGCLQ